MKKIGTEDKRNGWYEFDAASSALKRSEMEANRPLTDHRAERYGQDMVSGNWNPNGEPLIFDHSGKCINGQHRFRGCEMKDTKFISYCIWLPKVGIGAFDTMDSGMMRTDAARFAILGIPHYSIAAALTKKLDQYEIAETTGMWPTFIRRSPKHLRLRFEKDKDEIYRACEVASKFKDNFKGLLTPTVVATVYFYASKRNSIKAHSFVEKLATGESLTKESPILLLRNRLTQEVLAKSKLPYVEKMALCIIAWNAFYTPRPLKVLKWDSRARFPVFV